MNKDNNAQTLSYMVGKMLFAGFRGLEIDDNHPVVRDIKRYHLGGVILFDKDLIPEHSPRNIANPEQLKKLTAALYRIASPPFFISVDQEGGKVARLKANRGFYESPAAAHLGTGNNLEITSGEGEKTARMLAEHGININYAPVVDVAGNSSNPVISQLARSFSADSQEVYHHAKAYLTGMKKHRIINCLKHFPGHGSSSVDSHLSLPDITESWEEDELLPYTKLIREELVDMVMVGHLFHKDLDHRYPASLSSGTITGLLRDKLSFNGVVITDDLGMRAIADNYPLDETIRLSIDAGVDILLFANMIDYDDGLIQKVHRTMMSLIETKKIAPERIRGSYERISKLCHSYYSPL